MALPRQRDVRAGSVGECLGQATSPTWSSWSWSVLLGPARCSGPPGSPACWRHLGALLLVGAARSSGVAATRVRPRTRRRSRLRRRRCPCPWSPSPSPCWPGPLRRTASVRADRSVANRLAVLRGGPDARGGRPPRRATPSSPRCGPPAAGGRAGDALRPPSSRDTGRRTPTPPTARVTLSYCGVQVDGRHAYLRVELVPPQRSLRGAPRRRRSPGGSARCRNDSTTPSTSRWSAATPCWSRDFDEAVLGARRRARRPWRTRRGDRRRARRLTRGRPAAVGQSCSHRRWRGRPAWGRRGRTRWG